MEYDNRRDLTTISLAFFFAFIGAGASQPFVISFLEDQKGLSLGQASLVLATVYFTLALCRFFIGFIVDRVGMQGAKVLGIATYALFPMVIYAASSFWVLLAGGLVWGIGASMLWTSSLVQIMNTGSPERFGTGTGIVRGTSTLALFIGSYVLSVIYAHKGPETLFLCAAAFGCVGIVAMLTSPKRGGVPEKPNLGTFFKVMASAEAKLVTVLLLCSGLAYGIVLNGVKTSIEAEYGKDWLQLLLPLFALAAILSNFVGGRLCDGAGRWRTFAWGFGVGGAGMLCAWAFASPYALAVAMAAMGVEFGVVPIAAIGWIGDRTRPEERTSVMGYILCFRDAGVAAAIVARSAFPDVATAFLVFGAVSVAGAACTGWMGAIKRRASGAQ